MLEYGRRFHPRPGRSVRRDTLARGRRCAARERRVNVIYAVSALLTAALFAYLLYALFKPEKF